MSVPKRLLLMW